MKTAETNTSTAMWWSRLASACMITTRQHAVLHVPGWPTNSRPIADKASALYQGHSAPWWSRVSTPWRPSGPVAAGKNRLAGPCLK